MAMAERRCWPISNATGKSATNFALPSRSVARAWSADISVCGPCPASAGVLHIRAAASARQPQPKPLRKERRVDGRMAFGKTSLLACARSSVGGRWTVPDPRITSIVVGKTLRFPNVFCV